MIIQSEIPHVKIQHQLKQNILNQLNVTEVKMLLWLCSNQNLAGYIYSSMVFGDIGKAVGDKYAIKAHDAANAFTAVIHSSGKSDLPHEPCFQLFNWLNPMSKGDFQRYRGLLLCAENPVALVTGLQKIYKSTPFA